MVVEQYEGVEVGGSEGRRAKSESRRRWEDREEANPCERSKEREKGLAKEGMLWEGKGMQNRKMTYLGHC